MTAITATYAYTCKVCEKVASTFSTWLKNFQYARQMAANREIAGQLIHLGYESQKEHSWILQQMNEQTRKEYNK